MKGIALTLGLLLLFSCKDKGDVKIVITDAQISMKSVPRLMICGEIINGTDSVLFLSDNMTSKTVESPEIGYYIELLDDSGKRAQVAIIDYFEMPLPDSIYYKKGTPIALPGEKLTFTVKYSETFYLIESDGYKLRLSYMTLNGTEIFSNVFPLEYIY